MNAVLQLFLDEATDNFVRDLWRRLHAAGLPSALLERGATPHITLAFGTGAQAEVLIKSLSRVMQAQAVFGLTFVSLATFANEKGALFFGPVVNETLLHFHAATSSAFRSHVDAFHPYNERGRWTPHCTLTMELSEAQLVQAFKLFGDVRLPWRAEASKVVLLEHPSLEVLASWTFI